jgi:hypothetical protein
MVTNTIEVKVSEVIRNLGLYPRAYVDEATVERLIDAIRAGESLPPLTVNQKLWLIDGFHRWTAYARLGIETTQAQRIVTDGDAEFFRLSVEANTAHGKPIGRNDYPRIIARAEELGLEPTVLAQALRVPAMRLSELKFITPHQNGDRPSTDINLERPTVGGAGGWSGLPYKGQGPWSKQVFYANTIREAIENKQIDWSRQKLVDALDRLYEALAMAERR